MGYPLKDIEGALNALVPSMKEEREEHENACKNCSMKDCTFRPEYN
jgi:hypothetical protein